MADGAVEGKKRTDRIRIFIRMLKQNLYPNFTTLKNKIIEEFGEAYDTEKHKKWGGNRRGYTYTRQTFYNDIKYLTSLGAKIEFDRAGHNGYCLLNNNWTGYASFLSSEDEMEAAVLGAQFAERILPPSELRDKIRGSVDSLWAEHALPDADTEVQWNSLIIQGLPVTIDPQVFQTIYE